ncbi:SULTR2 [Symbiodinium sp. KB8]|nr:SULTR2 [Symbiodinium sp. KB8]
MWPSALVSALIGFMEAISVAQAMALRFGTPLDPNQELLGLGAANTLGAFFNAHPQAGAFSRTVVNGDAGARTQLAGMASSAVLAIVVVFLTGLFEFLPAATLGSMIIFAVIGLVELGTPRMLFAVDRRDLFVYIVAFVATLGLGIEQGILIGAAISLVRVVQESSKPHVAELGLMPDDVMPDTWRSVKQFPGLAKPKRGLRVVRFDAPIYFANALTFKQCVLNTAATPRPGQQVPRAVLIDCSAVSMLDSTALHVLEALPDELCKAADARKATRVRALIRLAAKVGAPVALLRELRALAAGPSPTAAEYEPATSYQLMRGVPHRDDDLSPASSPEEVAFRLRLVLQHPPRVPLLFLACVPVPVLRTLQRSDAFDIAERLREEARRPSAWSCEYPCGCDNPLHGCCDGCRPPPGGQAAVDAELQKDMEAGAEAQVRWPAWNSPSDDPNGPEDSPAAADAVGGRGIRVAADALSSESVMAAAAPRPLALSAAASSPHSTPGVNGGHGADADDPRDDVPMPALSGSQVAISLRTATGGRSLDTAGLPSQLVGSAASRASFAPAAGGASQRGLAPTSGAPSPRHVGASVAPGEAISLRRAASAAAIRLRRVNSGAAVSASREPSASGIHARREATLTSIVAHRTATGIDLSVGVTDESAFHEHVPVLQLVLRDKDIHDAVKHVTRMFREFDLSAGAAAKREAWRQAKTAAMLSAADAPAPTVAPPSALPPRLGASSPGMASGDARSGGLA